MFLSAPAIATWFISSVLVLIAIASKYLGLSIPGIGALIDGNLFEVLLVAYALLWSGNLFRGL